MKIEGIKSEDELEKAQAAAQAQNQSITNYKEWSDILKVFEQYGIESTGSYSSDVAKMHEIEKAVEEYVQEMQTTEQTQVQNTSDNKETEKVQSITENDREQEVKSNVGNANSYDIMADYMKYYHLLF